MSLRREKMGLHVGSGRSQRIARQRQISTLFRHRPFFWALAFDFGAHVLVDACMSVRAIQVLEIWWPGAPKLFRARGERRALFFFFCSRQEFPTPSLFVCTRATTPRTSISTFVGFATYVFCRGSFAGMEWVGPTHLPQRFLLFSSERLVHAALRSLF